VELEARGQARFSGLHAAERDVSLGQSSPESFWAFELFELVRS